MDYGEAELPQTRLWQAATWPLSLALSTWLLILRRTSPVRSDGAAAQGPAVYAIWHRYSLLMSALLLPRIHSPVALCGTAPHVRFLRYAGRLLGLGMIPGTPGQGAKRALEKLAAELAQGASVIMAVDGPRGPAYQAKPGCVWLARSAGSPIIPVALGGHGISSLWNWDQMLLPWPINRIRMRFGAPVWPGQDEAAALAEVERQLHSLHHEIGMPG